MVGVWRARELVTMLKIDISYRAMLDVLHRWSILGAPPMGGSCSVPAADGVAAGMPVWQDAEAT